MFGHHRNYPRRSATDDATNTATSWSYYSAEQAFGRLRRVYHGMIPSDVESDLKSTYRQRAISCIKSGELAEAKAFANLGHAFDLVNRIKKIEKDAKRR